MPQPKNGLINLINNQGNRSDNDAPQDQCCFVVFMSFSGGLGLKLGLVSRLGLGAGVAGSCFIFLCVPVFVNSCGSDAVLGINDIWCGSGVIVRP